MNIRTVEGDAKENEDFLKLDEQIEFTDDCLDKQEIEITIVNSKEFEPDEEFYVELYNPATGKRLKGQDTRTIITIIDDDKPPVLCFKSEGMI